MRLDRSARALPPFGSADDGGQFPVSRPAAGASDCGGNRTVHQWRTSVARSRGTARMGREGNAVRAAHALETRCCRDVNGGLPGADPYVVPKGGKSACHNTLGQLRCAMWPVGRRTSRTAYSPIKFRSRLSVAPHGSHPCTGIRSPAIVRLQSACAAITGNG